MGFGWTGKLPGTPCCSCHTWIGSWGIFWKERKIVLSLGSKRDPQAARKPGGDSSRGVADERCNMRWGDKGLIRKRTKVAQSCRREVLLETRGALQRLLQPRKPAEDASWDIQGLKLTLLGHSEQQGNRHSCSVFLLVLKQQTFSFLYFRSYFGLVSILIKQCYREKTLLVWVLCWLQGRQGGSSWSSDWFWGANHKQKAL